MGRRTETTEYLKECIADALLRLMETQPVDKIKIQDITDLAGVGRMTYFRYFSSKGEVLSYKLHLLWSAWAQGHPYPHQGGPADQALWFFSFCASLQPLLALLHRQGQHQVLLEVFLREVVGAIDPTVPGFYPRMYAGYGILGVLMGWLQNGFRERPEDLARLVLLPTWEGEDKKRTGPEGPVPPGQGA